MNNAATISHAHAHPHTLAPNRDHTPTLCPCPPHRTSLGTTGSAKCADGSGGAAVGADELQRRGGAHARDLCQVVAAWFSKHVHQESERQRMS